VLILKDRFFNKNTKNNLLGKKQWEEDNHLGLSFQLYTQQIKGFCHSPVRRIIKEVHF